MKWKSSTTTYSMPASLIAAGRCGSQTLSASQIPLWFFAEMLFYELRELPYLAQLVLVREQRQDGLVEAAAHDLRLPRFHHRSDGFDEIRVVFQHPLKERAREVQVYLEPGDLPDRLHEWEIGVMVRLFRDMVEVPYRLMVMDGEDEFYFFHGPFKRKF